MVLSIEAFSQPPPHSDDPPPPPGSENPISPMKEGTPRVRGYMLAKSTKISRRYGGGDGFAQGYCMTQRGPENRRGPPGEAREIRPGSGAQAFA